MAWVEFGCHAIVGVSAPLYCDILNIYCSIPPADIEEEGRLCLLEGRQPFNGGVFVGGFEIGTFSIVLGERTTKKTQHVV